MIKIAVLITCYNRKEKTAACLERLFSCLLPSNYAIKVYLVDDASTDGTGHLLSKVFPEVNVVYGTGELYWAGGMRLAWNTALKDHPDYFLLINDDTDLKDDAIVRLLNFYDLPDSPPDTITVGSTLDKEKNEVSYGGRMLRNKRRVNSIRLYSETDYLECDMANANILLVPDSVVSKIGILSDKFTHSIADLDYILRAKAAGLKTIVVPGILGYCQDDHGNNWKSSEASLKERMEYLRSPKGLAYKEYMWFIRKHFVLSLPEAFIKLWLKTLFPILWTKFKLNKQG
jgi:GT2 family glycosyltransferase